MRLLVLVLLLVSVARPLLAQPDLKPSTLAPPDGPERATRLLIFHAVW